MRKILAESALIATTLASQQILKQTSNSFVLNVTISDYMPNVYLGAGENN